MATTTTQSNVNISDIPEELKPFRQAGLESLMSLVYDPRYIAELKARGIFPSGTYAPPSTSLPGGGGSPGGDTRLPGDPGYDATTTGQNQGNNALLSDSNIATLMKQIRGSGTDLTSDIKAAMGSKLTSTQSDGGVNLTGVGVDLNGNPYPVNQRPGGGTGDIVWLGETPDYSGYVNKYPPVTVTPTYQAPRIPTGSNPTTPPGGSTPPGGGGTTPPGGGGGAPPVRQNYDAGMGTLPGAVGQSGPMTDPAYNSSHYAPDALAQQIAQALGATVSHTSTGGPNGPPPQNLINWGFGGTGNNSNAGLVASLLTDPSQSQHAAQRLRDELAVLGGAPTYAQNQAPRQWSSAEIPVFGYAKGGRIPYGNGISRYDTGGTLPAAGSSYPYAQYTPFEGQRFLDPNANPDPNNIATSQATRQAEHGLSSIPSMFDEAGGINAGRTETGEATTNFGIANDQMDWAGDKLGDAIEGYGSIANSANQLSNFNYSPTLKSAGQISVDPLNRYQISPSAMWTDAGTSQAYMSPYMDAVTGVQKQRAIDDFNEQRGARNSQAVGAGAFGGSRQAVQEGLAQRALNRNLQSIDANGLNNAYNSGMGQFNTDRTADFTTNRANLDSNLQTQGLATQAGLTAAQANQSTNATQYGQLMNAQQQAEQLRQNALTAGGNQQLQAMQGITGAAGALSSVGATRADLQRLAQQLEQSRLTSQAQAGAAQDSRAQQGLDFQYQNFVNQKNYPFQLQNFYTSQLAGNPMGVNQEQVQFQNYSPLSQWGGLISSGIGAVGSALNKQ